MSREPDKQEQARGKRLVSQEQSIDCSDPGRRDDAPGGGASVSGGGPAEQIGTRSEPESGPAQLTGPTAGSTADQSASDVAWALAELVPAIPEPTAVDLKRLLSRSLTNPSPAERREARLGLVIELVSDGQGQVPAVADYEEARQERAARGGGVAGQLNIDPSLRRPLAPGRSLGNARRLRWQRSSRLGLRPRLA
jgi:hypothetical protein